MCSKKSTPSLFGAWSFFLIHIRFTPSDGPKAFKTNFLITRTMVQRPSSMVHNLNRPLLLSSDQQLWIQGRRKCKLMLQTHRQTVPGNPSIRRIDAKYDFSKLQCSWSSVGEIPWDRPAVTYCPLIRAMPLLDGRRRTGTRLFLRMPRMCGKHFDTAEESTGCAP